MVDIKSDLESIWVSFVEATIRFFNNRFQLHNEEVLYLREQISLLRNENRELINNLFLNPKQEAINTNEEPEEFKPVTSGRHIPWHEKRRILEANSRKRAIELAQEAQVESERTKSTEQLEQELGIKG